MKFRFCRWILDISGQERLKLFRDLFKISLKLGFSSPLTLYYVF